MAQKSKDNSKTQEDKAMTSAQESYGADQITVLEGLEPVRKRPGMYIGSTGIDGLHHLVTEIVNNSMDEAIAGFANHVKVEFFKDQSVAVYDNGRGIPYGIKKGYKVSALELAFTVLHAGGKFGGGGYKVSSGLHGVGASVVNALSEWCRVIVRRSPEVVMQEFENGGKPVSPVAPVDAKKIKSKIKGSEWTLDVEGWNYNSGTIVQFLADKTIFETTNYNIKFFVNQLREYAYLTAGIKFELVDHRADFHQIYYFEGGIKTFLRSLNRNKAVMGNTVFHVKKDLDGVSVEAALQYNDSFNENVLSFANHIKTGEGGTHLTGFRTALTKTINDYARKNGYLKEKDENLTGQDISEGLTAIVSVKLESETLQFEGQTKGKLGNSNVRPAVETVVKEALDIFFEENPREAQAIVEKNILSLKARMAAKAARDTVIRKSALDGGGVLPGKLADCSERDPEKAELFIVEGDSAGGCFVKETKVALADGRNLSFEDIVKEQKEGKEHFCYTIRSNGKIGVQKFINARITKKNTNVIKLTLDNMEEIICTPDHLFMLRNGTYKKAATLLETESIMPLNKKLSDKKEKGITIEGYEMVWDPKSDKWMFTHILADYYNRYQEVYKLSDGGHCHHIDFHKYNNNPTNLIRMNSFEHFQLHRDHVEKTLHRPEVIEKSKKAKQTAEFRQKMSERMKKPQTRTILSRNAKKQWENQEYKKYMNKKWNEFYNNSSDYQDKNKKQLDKAQKDYWNIETNKESQSNRVRQYYINNPKAKQQLVQSAKEQWCSTKLLAWRSDKTKTQWTPEFRIKRLSTLHETYYKKTLNALKLFEEKDGINKNQYDSYRITKKDKSLLKLDTFLERYFNGSVKQALETIHNYNHKVVKIEKLNTLVDVYDAEVPETHNFALAAGVFVHNSAKQGRSREFQAILPLRGKVLNTERARLDKVVESDTFKQLIIAIGAGIGEQYNKEKLRYHKIIIMSDADVDGSHIRTLHLTFFYRHLHEVIANGHVYVAMPPLYKAAWGKEKLYIFDDADLIKFQKTEKGKKAVIQRFKGLGEMNPDELWETTMNPDTRHLKQVTIDDVAKADATFTMLMGDEVPPRKKFIQTHAKNANIDLT